jgi:hypothetical protein
MISGFYFTIRTQSQIVWQAESHVTEDESQKCREQIPAEHRLFLCISPASAGLGRFDSTSGPCLGFGRAVSELRRKM